MRRMGCAKPCANVDVIGCNKIPFTQDIFLSNEQNKSNFIKFLAAELKRSGNSTVNCEGDGDATIVSKSLEKLEMIHQLLLQLQTILMWQWCWSTIGRIHWMKLSFFKKKWKKDGRWVKFGIRVSGIGSIFFSSMLFLVVTPPQLLLVKKKVTYSHSFGEKQWNTWCFKSHERCRGVARVSKRHEMKSSLVKNE